jgi:cation:H+ antiporter
MTGFVAVVVHAETLRWWHGALLTAPYLIYLVYLFITHKKVLSKDGSFDYNPTDGQIHWADIGMINLEKFVLRGKMIRVTNAWILLVVSILVMVLGTWMLVHGTHLLGEELGIPLLFVAVVLSAAASSIPDTMISIRDAKKGNYEDAFSNALGSNIFDISFALGFPLLIYTLVNGSIAMEADIVASSSDLWLVLFLITGFTILIFTIGKYLTTFKTLLLILLYMIFLVFVVIDFRYNIDFVGAVNEIIKEAINSF